MNDIRSWLPPGLRHMDEDEKALAELPDLAARMTYHTKRLRAVTFIHGAEGVREYKAKHPEARGIQTISNPIAYVPKPKGYDEFLCDLVDAWFISNAALAETNRAIVERLNAKLDRQFDPDRRLSVPLSTGRLRKLATVFEQHGARLDTSKPLSLSKIRGLAKAARSPPDDARPFGHIGRIRGKELTIGAHSFIIGHNGNRACIRPTIDGTKRRIYLDDLLWMADLLAPLPHYSPTGGRIREWDYSPKTSPPEPDADPLADIPPGNGTISETPVPREQDYPADPPSLAERIETLKAARIAREHSMACDDDTNPLAF